MKIPILNFRTWLENKGLKARTIKDYMYYCNKFLPYHSFTQENVNKYLADKGNMNHVARGFLINLKKFLMVNYKELGLDQDSRIEVAEVELPALTGRIKQRLVKPLTEEQVLEIEKYLEGELNKLKLLMSYYAGLRIGELYKIRIVSFNWDEWKKDMNQVGECRVYGKGDKEGLAFFPSKLMKRIAKHIHAENYPSLSSYLFMKKFDSEEQVNIDNRMKTWGKQLKKAAIKAGIIKFDSSGEIIHDTDVYPHKLRHSWGYHLKNVKKMDLRDIQEILRHSSITSTQRYTYTDKSHLKKILIKDVFDSED